MEDVKISDEWEDFSITSVILVLMNLLFCFVATSLNFSPSKRWLGGLVVVGVYSSAEDALSIVPAL